jgi:hypothetical protein
MNLKSSTSDSQRHQQSVIIPAVLKNRGTPVKNAPVTAGLCLPKGRLKDAISGQVEGFSSPIPGQFEVLNRWNDGSVRWMLASFAAPDASNQSKSVSVHVDSAASVHDGVNTASVDRTTTIKIVNSELRINCRDFTREVPSEHSLHLTPGVCGLEGEELPVRFDGIREEVAGPVRQVFVANARLEANPSITLQLRLTYWTAAGLLQIETRIRNTQRARHSGGLWDLGDAGSFLFRSFEISVRCDEIPPNATTRWRTDRTAETRSTTHEVFLKQISSGGRFWNSTNQVTFSGDTSVCHRGFEAVCDSGTLRGYRAEPTFLMQGDESFLGLAVPEFWQNFPGSIAAAMGSLEVGLFPAVGDLTHELQGGEQKTQSFCLAVGNGHSDIHLLDWAYDAPRLMQLPESIQDSKVLPWFVCSPTCLRSRVPGTMNAESMTSKSIDSAGSETEPRARLVDLRQIDLQKRFASYLHTATSARFSIEQRRASIDEYGWRNYGDVPADHEQTHYAGSNTIVSHYNNQFDMIYGGVLQMASTSDLKWFDLLDPLARHVIDIDIYHTNADRAAFNGGLFWHTDHYVDAKTSTHRTYSKHNQKPGQPYGGGPSCEHNYTTGLLHYHFLTGSPEAKDSVLSLAEWVIQMDDGRNTIFGLLDNGPTGAASATVFEDFHGPGRGAGNSVNALLDAWILTGSERYLSESEELIRRCVHPSQNPDDLHLLDAEGHWSYTVFMNSLGRYLLAKRDAEQIDGMYRYARDVMQTFGRWMAANERRTLDRPTELQYPTEAWAAQDFRKANVLRIAASCEDDPNAATAMILKADQISDAAWQDFDHFGDASFTTRCLSITMTEGHRELFHRHGHIDAIPICDATYDVLSWSMFVPQKLRIKAILKSPGRLLRASINVLKPSRLLSACRALRRQM